MLTSRMEKLENAPGISKNRQENNPITPSQGDQALLNCRYELMLSGK